MSLRSFYGLLFDDPYVLLEVVRLVGRGGRPRKGLEGLVLAPLVLARTSASGMGAISYDTIVAPVCRARPVRKAAGAMDGLVLSFADDEDAEDGALTLGVVAASMGSAHMYAGGRSERSTRESR